MLRPIIVIMENATKPEGLGYFRDMFLQKGLYPILNSFDVASFADQRIKAEDVLVVAPKKESDDFKKICLYVRDIGIDEEKRIFLCGFGDTYERAQTLLPAMVRRGTYEINAGEMDYVAHQISETIPSRSKGVLIVDEDRDYIRNLMTALAPYCTIAVSDGSLEETTPYINEVDLMIVSLDLRTDFLAMSKLFRIISKTRRERDYHMIFIVRSHERRKEVNSSLEDNAVCLSKETDFVKNAAYIIGRYLKESNLPTATKRESGGSSTLLSKI